MWIACLYLLIILITLAWYFDIIPFKNVVLREIEEINFIYFEYLSSFQEISGHFDIITKILQEKNVNIDSIRYGGCYFDDPKKVADKNKMRYALGIFVSDRTVDEIWGKLESTTDFKKVKLPRAKALCTMLTYRNFLSYFLFPYFYGTIGKKAKELDIAFTGEEVSLEIYDINVSRQICLHLVLNNLEGYHFYGSSK